MRLVHQAQLLSYLKLADKKLGFLINFNVVLINREPLRLCAFAVKQIK